MGVITIISLDELNKLFPTYNFTKITPTISGIIDTTYIVYTNSTSYILKKYERDIADKINKNILLLSILKSAGLNVPIYIDKKDEWYLYERLKGEQPKVVKNYHIQLVARFLSKMHKETSKITCDSNKIMQDEISEALKYIKANFFIYYKKFEFLKHLIHKKDGIIHGDIFKDNTVFNNKKIGVIDFIDSSCGTFAYDVAIALVGFDVKTDNNYFINLFLKNYNQHAPKKLKKSDVIQNMIFASRFFTLKRIHKYKNTSRAKELL